jgi:peroxiredoxin Q/BCP
MLKVGDQAPDFLLHDQNGKSVSVSEFKGKNVVLYFYPKDDTPGCTRQAVGFTEQKSQFNQKNTVIIGISKDSIEDHQKFCNKYNLDLILASDPEKKAIEAYGVWQEKTLYGKKSFGIVRSTFLISSEGVIQKIWSNVKVDGHIDAVLNEIA